MLIIKSYFSQDKNVKYQNSSIHCGESVSFTAIYNAVNTKTDPMQSKLNTRIWKRKKLYAWKRLLREIPKTPTPTSLRWSTWDSDRLFTSRSPLCLSKLLVNSGAHAYCNRYQPVSNAQRGFYAYTCHIIRITVVYFLNKSIKYAKYYTHEISKSKNQMKTENILMLFSL